MRYSALAIVALAFCAALWALVHFACDGAGRPAVEHLLQDEPSPQPGDREERARLMERSAELTRLRDRAREMGDRKEADRLDAELAEVFIQLSKINRRLGPQSRR